MPCYHPVQVWRSAQKNASGKRSLVFNNNGGHGSPFLISCGKCIGCRLRRAAQWAVRLTHEAKYHEEVCFITLTYSEEHLPPDGSLNKKHLQDFWKRLRAHVARSGLYPAGHRLRYLACGEYGENLKRPHYHAALFGVAFLQDRRPYGRARNGQPKWTSATLDELWGKGRTEIGTLTLKSANYTAGYTTKKVYGDKADEHYQGRQPEFLVCSRGIGKRWFEDFEADLRDDYVILDGTKYPVPPYYDKLMVTEEQERRKAARKEASIQDWRNRTPQRLAARKEVKVAQKSLSLNRSFSK